MTDHPPPDPHPHPDPTVAAALVRLDAVDPAAALDARAVLDWLVDDGGLDELSQFSIQQFCWYDLPFKWLVDPAIRHELLEAMARFLDLAGLPRYAAICRDERTNAIGQAWDGDPVEGFRAWRRAAEASGVEPPDLPDFAWGTLMGADELGAFRSTAQALELAIVAGALRPGAPGWRIRQLEVAATHVHQPQAALFGQPPLAAAVTERLAHWVEAGGSAPLVSHARSQLLAPTANALLHPVPPPRAAHRVVAPMRWLVALVDNALVDPTHDPTHESDGDRRSDRSSGVRLTAGGQLPVAAARAAAAAWPGWVVDGRDPSSVRRAADVPGLVVVHRLALDLGLVQLRQRRLVVTRRGGALLRSPRAADAWPLVTDRFALGDGFAAAARELLLAVLLDDAVGTGAARARVGTAPTEAVAEVVVALTESGWQRGATGEPVVTAEVAAEFGRLADEARLLGLARWVGPHRARRLQLGETGIATVRAALRARALRPPRVRSSR